MAKWYTCPVCHGTGALRVVEGSGWRLETDPRCNGSGIVETRLPGELDLNSTPPEAVIV